MITTASCLVSLLLNIQPYSYRIVLTNVMLYYWSILSSPKAQGVPMLATG